MTVTTQKGDVLEIVEGLHVYVKQDGRDEFHKWDTLSPAKQAHFSRLHDEMAALLF